MQLQFFSIITESGTIKSSPDDVHDIKLQSQNAGRLDHCSLATSESHTNFAHPNPIEDKHLDETMSIGFEEGLFQIASKIYIYKFAPHFLFRNSC